jgi:uncharacterized protein
MDGTPVRSLSLITKVTRICNLRCVYCHEWADTKSVMEFETVANLIAKSLQCSGIQFVRFIWHGGEPLVRGRDFYKKAMFIQERARGSGQVIANCIQTNGTLLDESWADFILENGIEIGLSVDGPEKLHNLQRPTVGGQATWHKTVNAVRLLQQRHISFGALVVVTDDTLQMGAEALFSFILETGIKSFAMLHLRPESLPDGKYDPMRDYLALDRFNRFQMEIFDLWFKHDNPDIHIREFDSILSMLLGGEAAICTLAGECVGKHFGVNVNGDVYHCDRYVSDNDYLLGNIVRDNWPAILTGDAIGRLKARNRTRVDRFHSCPELPICHGGCPHNYYIQTRTLNSSSKELECCGEASLINHIRCRLASSLEATSIGSVLRSEAGVSVWQNQPSPAVQ